MPSNDTAIANSSAFAGRPWLAETMTRESMLRVLLSLRRLLKGAYRVSRTKYPVETTGPASVRGLEHKRVTCLSLPQAFTPGSRIQAFRNTEIKSVMFALADGRSAKLGRWRWGLPRRFMQRNVVQLTAIIPHYRVPFYNSVRCILAQHDVNYEVLYGVPSKLDATKGDLVSLDWGTRINNHYFGPRNRGVLWQDAWWRVAAADLSILGQENKLLINYPLQILQSLIRPKIALWGHGRNFQSAAPRGPAEAWKSFWTTRCHWWFAYTQKVAQEISQTGFPREKITVFDNAIDTSALKALSKTISPQEIDLLRSRLGIKTGKLAIYIGGIYPEKRIDFLIGAADQIQARLPDFHLIIIGGGVDYPLALAASKSRPWLHVLGPVFGREKALYMGASDVFLMPGLIGLAILDCSAFGLPIVTTAYPHHSPEFYYMTPDFDGVVVNDWQSIDDYVAATCRLLLDERRRTVISENFSRLAERYNIQNMASRFASGVLKAL